jgi:hypothetical protein
MSHMTTRLELTARWLSERDLLIPIVALALLAFVIIGLALTVLTTTFPEPALVSPIRWAARMV